MPRNLSLSDEECAVVLALFKDGKRIMNLSAELGRSRSAVRRVIESGKERGVHAGLALTANCTAALTGSGL